MTSPPSLTQIIITLSKIGKYSLDPGCAEVGGTFSFILAHRSCSSGFAGLPCMAGNGQRPQGSPGHKHPLQLASTEVANITSDKPQIKTTLTFRNSAPGDRYILAPYISSQIMFTDSNEQKLMLFDILILQYLKLQYSCREKIGLGCLHPRFD